MTRVVVMRAFVLPNIYCIIGLWWACLCLVHVAHAGYTPVTKTSVRGISSTEALITWSPPGNANDTLIGYEVYQDSVIDGDIDGTSAVLIASLSPSATTALASGLQPHRTYELGVFAKYSSGYAQVKLIEYHTQHSMTPPQYHEPSSSLSLANSTTWVSLPRVHGHSPGQPFSVAMWVFLTGSSDMVFLQVGVPSTLRLASVSGYLEAQVQGISGSVQTYTMTEFLPSGQWVHIFCSVSAGVVTIAMGDYSEAYNTAPVLDLPALSGGSEDRYLWNISSAAYPVQGFVSQLKIWRTIKQLESESQVAELCNSILDPTSQPDLLAYYPLDEGQGNEARNLRGGPAGVIHQGTWFQYTPSTPPTNAGDSGGETCARCVDDIFVVTRGEDGARQLQFMVPAPANISNVGSGNSSNSSNSSSSSSSQTTPGLTVAPGRLAVSRSTGFYSTIAALRPTAYYPLDEAGGAVAHDRSGHNRHLYYYPGATQHTECSISNNRIGGCVEIGSTNPSLQYEDLAQEAGHIWGGGWTFAGLVWRNQAITVAFWMKPTGYPSIKPGHIVGTDGWSIGYDGSGQIAMYVRNRGAFWMSVSPTYPPLDAWTHVALIWTGEDISIYLNGTWASRDNAFAYSTLNPVPGQPSMAPLQIGYCHQCSSTPESFQGRLADVVIFDRHLLPDQIPRLAGLKSVSVDGGITSQQVLNSRLPSHPMVSKGSRTVIHGHVDVAGDAIVRGRDFTFTQDPARREVTLHMHGMGEVPTVIPQPPWRVSARDPRNTGCPEIILTYPEGIKEIPALTFMAVGESRHQWPVGHWRNPAPICSEVDPNYASIWTPTFKTAYLGVGSCTAVPNICTTGGNGNNWPLVHRAQHLPPYIFKPTALTPLAGSQSVVIGGTFQTSSTFQLADGTTINANSNDVYLTSTNLHNDSLAWMTLATGAFDVNIRGLVTMTNEEGEDEYIVVAFDSVIGTAVTIHGESYANPTSSGNSFTVLVALSPRTGEVEWAVTIYDPAGHYYGHQLIGPTESSFPGTGSLVMIGTAYNAIKIRWSDGSESTTNADSSSGTRDIFVVRTNANGQQINWGTTPSFFYVGSEGDDLFSTATPVWTNGGRIAIGAMWERGTGDWGCQHDTGSHLSSGSYAGTYKEIIFQVDQDGRCNGAQASVAAISGPFTYLQALIPTGDSQKIIAIGSVPSAINHTFSNGGAPTGSSSGQYVIAEWFRLSDMNLEQREDFNPSEPGAQLQFVSAHLAGDSNESPLVFAFEVATGAFLGAHKVEVPSGASHPVFAYYHNDYGIVAYDVMSTAWGAQLKALVANPEREMEPYTLIHVDGWSMLADMDSRFRNSSYTRSGTNLDYLGVLHLYGYQKDD